MNGIWNNQPKTILADIGLRLVSTGFVIAVVSGMADIFGFGTQLSPEIPYYGPWQAMGVLFGEVVIIIGFIFQIPFRKPGERLEPSTEDDESFEQTELNIVLE